MSGNGDGDNPIGGNEGVSCENLVIDTQLSSPNKEVLESLSVGDILYISIVSDQGPVQALTNNGDVAGGILSSRVIDLVNCIVNDHQYLADVLEINGAICRIRIRPA